jgi:hypothetical protein
MGFPMTSLSDVENRQLDFDSRIMESIERRTHRQIKRLQVAREGDSIVLAGLAPSYHVVQLAIIAGMTALAETPLRLESRLAIASVARSARSEVTDAEVA